MGLHSVEIHNFKSIKSSGPIRLGAMNVLIGANGSGKSNFISFFKLLKKIHEGNFQFHVAKNGRADAFLHFGSKNSDFLAGEILADNQKEKYQFRLVKDATINLFFNVDNYLTRDNLNDKWSAIKVNTPNGHRTFESYIARSNGISENGNQRKVPTVFDFSIYHFNDTSFNANIKNPPNITDYAYLHEDGGNLAAFLYRLSLTEKARFEYIEETVRSIAPFFDKFYLEPDDINPNQIFLHWQEKGASSLFNAHTFSDGTLRFIALVTALLQPKPPETIIIDEPELGLHPSAIGKLAAILQSASVKTQIIIATQSVDLVSQFSANDIIVVDRERHQSPQLVHTTFKRQSEKELEHWLEDYSVGELWEKNVIGGRP